MTTTTATTTTVRPASLLRRVLAWRIAKARSCNHCALWFQGRGCEAQARQQRRRRDMHLEAARTYQTALNMEPQA